MTVTVYKSTDSGAPVMSGTVGALTNVLQKCLVEGYGSKAAAGWSQAFSGTNKIAFRQGAKSGRLQFYLRVQDDAPGAGGARESRQRGFETMTDVDTGANDFPTVVQLAAGIIVRKSTTADATARAWMVLADHRTFMLFIISGDADTMQSGFYFGDLRSYVNNEQYGCVIVGRVVENSGVVGNEVLHLVTTDFGSPTVTGHYAARNYLGLTASWVIGKHMDKAKSNNAAGAGLGGMSQQPNPADSREWLSYFWAVELQGSNRIVRGYLRGVWAPMHLGSLFTNGDSFNGATGTPLVGKSFQVAKIDTTSHRTVVVEISDTWDAD